MERVLTPVKRRRRPILLNIDKPSPNRYWDWMPSGRRTKWARDCTGGWSEKEEVGTWWRHDMNILPVLLAFVWGYLRSPMVSTQTGSVMRSTGWCGRPIYCIVNRLSICIYIYISRKMITIDSNDCCPQLRTKRLSEPMVIDWKTDT